MQKDQHAVRTAKLIYNPALLLLVEQLAEEVNLAIKLSRESEDLGLSKALVYEPGFNHLDTGILLGKAWCLPDPLMEAMAVLSGCP